MNNIVKKISFSEFDRLKTILETFYNYSGTINNFFYYDHSCIGLIRKIDLAVFMQQFPDSFFSTQFAEPGFAFLEIEFFCSIQHSNDPILAKFSDSKSNFVSFPIVQVLKHKISPKKIFAIDRTQPLVVEFFDCFLVLAQFDDSEYYDEIEEKDLTKQYTISLTDFFKKNYFIDQPIIEYAGFYEQNKDDPKSFYLLRTKILKCIPCCPFFEGLLDDIALKLNHQKAESELKLYCDNFDCDEINHLKKFRYCLNCGKKILLQEKEKFLVEKSCETEIEEKQICKEKIIPMT